MSEDLAKMYLSWVQSSWYEIDILAQRLSGPRTDVIFWWPICMLQELWYLVGSGWLAGADEQGSSIPCEANHLECTETNGISGAAHEVLQHLVPSVPKSLLVIIGFFSSSWCWKSSHLWKAWAHLHVRRGGDTGACHVLWNDPGAGVKFCIWNVLWKISVHYK